MGKSQRLTLGQVRAVGRLVEECREVGDDPGRWRPHLLCGINTLVGAMFATTAELDPAGLDGPRLVGFIDVGLPVGGARERWDEFIREGGFVRHPAGARFATIPGPRNTRRRRELLTDDEWYRSRFYEEWVRPFGVDDGLISVHPGPGGMGFMLSPGRAIGERPFDGRGAGLCHLIQLALAPHLGRSLATTADPVCRLSPRLRETLDYLLEGDSEKHAAARLGISPATVREYVQALYRHFGVSTRAELMAHFLRRYRDGRCDRSGAAGNGSCAGR